MLSIFSSSLAGQATQECNGDKRPLQYIEVIPIESWLPCLLTVLVLFLVARKLAKFLQFSACALPSGTQTCKIPSIERVRLQIVSLAQSLIPCQVLAKLLIFAFKFRGIAIGVVISVFVVILCRGSWHTSAAPDIAYLTSLQM